MKFRHVPLVALVIVLLAGPAVAGQWPHERDGFMIGFNLGGGTAVAKADDDESDSGGGGAGSFRLGWAFADQFVVGFESTAWSGKTDENSDLTLSSYKVNFTWYPGATGWFVRVGAGGSSAEFTTDWLGGFSVKDSGGSLGLGAGHEWRLTRTFALGAAVDFNTVDLDLIDFTFTNFTAQLNWYF